MKMNTYLLSAHLLSAQWSFSLHSRKAGRIKGCEVGTESPLLKEDSEVRVGLGERVLWDYGCYLVYDPGGCCFEMQTDGFAFPIQSIR